MRRALAIAAVLGLALAGCDRPLPRHADAMSAIDREDPAEGRLSYKWKFAAAERLTELYPEEHAAAAVSGDTVFVGSDEGVFYALGIDDGHIRWKSRLGPVGTAPLVAGNTVYVGTKHGALVALDTLSGKEKWRYESHGLIQQPPTMSGDLIVFANGAGQVIALESGTGKFKWQYKGEVPEEYMLRGHAGVRADEKLLYTGFPNGTLVALRRDTGSVAWSTSLKGDAERFVDVNGTPLVIGPNLYVSSASGGVYAIDKATGLIRWRAPFYDVAQPSATGNVGGLTSDGRLLFVSVADLGVYALDFSGNVVWRVGAHGGGDPSTPVVVDDLLVYSLAESGLFLADRRSGATVQYFDPGAGISAQPTVTGDGRLFVMSNRGILYAFDLDDEELPVMDRIREWYHGVY